MAYLLPTDELNVLKRHLNEWSDKGKLKPEKRAECEDELLDLLLMAYVLGCDSANADLGTDIKSTADEAMKSVMALVDGKTFSERVDEYFNNGGTAEDILRIADTEAHRDFCLGGESTAFKAGAKTKTWVTMEDSKVRDEHWLLDGVRIPLNERFYVGEDSALAPGGFESANLNVNCRCWLTYQNE